MARASRRRNEPGDLQPGLRRAATSMLARLEPGARESLLVRCWMSHAARWFMAVADEAGLAVANRLNRAAAHELGKVEARRILRALDRPPVTTLDEYLVLQEVLIGVLGPDLLDYAVTRAGEGAYRIQVRRCFAYDRAARAGIAGQYECGIFARVTGWLEGLGLPYATDPPLGPCLRACGRPCGYTITLWPPASAEA